MKSDRELPDSSGIGITCGSDRKINRVKHASDRVAKRLSRASETHPPSRPVEKSGTDEMFKSTDLLRQCGLGDVFRFRCSTEVQGRSHGQEVPDLARLDHSSSLSSD